ncbi:hypothetical protein [Nocardia cyriacigeorgica]|uniref:hypothetical protein n=1 Tax=Nocardia cyriacigeorgica TaxID=135487 RepID=UPI0034DB5293
MIKPASALLAAASVATLTACSPEADEPKAQWSISFNWTAGPDVDLDDTWARIVRAAIESNTVAEYFGPEYGYPGWIELPDAVDPTIATQESPVGATGTAYLHLMEWKSPSGATGAVVCKDMSQTAKVIDGRYPLPDPNNPHETFEAVKVNVGEEPRPVNAVRDFSPVEIPPGPEIPGPPGRAARPDSNVFLFPVSVYYPHGGDQYRDVCESWDRWRSVPTAPQRDETTPPTVEPYSPGWPVK